MLIGLGITGGIILSAQGVENGKTAGELTSEATPADAIPAGTMEEGEASLEISIAPQQGEQLGAGTNEAGILRSTERTPNPGYAAGEILETLDGWYRIRSGSIVGYISSDIQYTAVGAEALQLALESAELMAIVSTERLNVRMEPSTESRIWAQISQEERYHVVSQMDGWVQIELDSIGENGAMDGAYISTRDNNVEVRYALAEAIPFTPLVEDRGNSGGSAGSGNSGGNGTAQTGGAPAGSGGQVVHASSRRTGIRISTWNYRTPSAIRRVL